MSLTIDEIKEELKNGAEGMQSDLTSVTTETANLIINELERLSIKLLRAEAEVGRLKKFNVQLAEGFTQNAQYAREMNDEKSRKIKEDIAEAYWKLALCRTYLEKNQFARDGFISLQNLYLENVE